MAGKKGRSGRRSLAIEIQRRQIIDKAWKVVDEALDNPLLDDKVKLDTASKLVTKDIPQEITGINNQQSIVIMQEIKKDNDALRYNLGSHAPEDTGHTE